MLDLSLLVEYISGKYTAEDFREILFSDISLSERVRIIYAEATGKDFNILSGIANADANNPCFEQYLDGIVKAVLDHEGISYTPIKRPKLTAKQLRSYDNKLRNDEVKLPISRKVIKKLIEYLEKRLAQKPCNNTFYNTVEFAKINGLDPQAVCEAFRECGAYCDCEILLNIDLD